MPAGVKTLSAALAARGWQTRQNVYNNTGVQKNIPESFEISTIRVAKIMYTM